MMERSTNREHGSVPVLKAVTPSAASQCDTGTVHERSECKKLTLTLLDDNGWIYTTWPMSQASHVAQDTL